LKIPGIYELILGMNGKVYRIEFPDGHFYIGRTIRSLESRLKEHKRFHMINHEANLISGRKPHTRFEIYISKNGWNNPVISTHTHCEVNSLQELHAIETSVIKAHFSDEKCLNDKCSGIQLHHTEQQRLSWLEGQLNSSQEPWRQFWINRVLENWNSNCIYPFGMAMEEFKASILSSN